MRLIIAGSRTVTSHAIIFTAITQALESWFPPELVADPASVIDEVVSGCAPGVDHSGEVWAKAQGIPVKHMPADWEKYGPAAGPIRNALMAKYAAEEQNGGLVAVWRHRSRGTASMIRLAKVAGLLIHVKEVR